MAFLCTGNIAYLCLDTIGGCNIELIGDNYGYGSGHYGIYINNNIIGRLFGYKHNYGICLHTGNGKYSRSNTLL